MRCTKGISNFFFVCKFAKLLPYFIWQINWEPACAVCVLPHWVCVCSHWVCVCVHVFVCVVAYKCQFLKAIHSDIWGKCILRIWFMRVPQKLIRNCHARRRFINKRTKQATTDGQTDRHGRRADRQTGRQINRRRSRQTGRQRRLLSRQPNSKQTIRIFRDGGGGGGTRKESHELQCLCYANVPAEATSMWVTREYIVP